jgi:hypothetical protein
MTLAGGTSLGPRDARTFCYSYGRHLSDLYVVDNVR